MRRALRIFGILGAALAGLTALPLVAKAEPLRIGFSDWPGFTGWQIAIDKGWFKEAGIDVDMQWFDYSASLDAFSAGKLDGDFIANGDGLTLGANGAKNVLILLTDYSNGNDMIVAKPGTVSIKELKGQKVAVEVGLVDHLLLEHALSVNGMAPADVTLVNTTTNATPQVLASGSVSAIAAWQPSSGQAMMQLPGSRPIYTSADAPGLIYDGLTVAPQSLKQHREEWKKIIQIWYHILDYIDDPKTHDDALKIMSARDGVTPKMYQRYFKGTHLLSKQEELNAFKMGETLASIYGSDKNADIFNVSHGIYKVPQNIESYIDGSLVEGR